MKCGVIEIRHKMQNLFTAAFSKCKCKCISATKLHVCFLLLSYPWKHNDVREHNSGYASSRRSVFLQAS